MIFWLAAEVLEEALFPELFDLIPIVDLTVLHDVCVHIMSGVLNSLITNVEVEVFGTLHLCSCDILKITVANHGWDNEIWTRVSRVTEFRITCTDIDDHWWICLSGAHVSRNGLFLKILSNRPLSNLSKRYIVKLSSMKARA